MKNSDDKQSYFAIIGCGLIGHKRAVALAELGQLLYACDVDFPKAESIAREQEGCAAVTNFKQVLEDDRVNIVIVSTRNEALAPIAMDVVKSGKHLLIEKPGALTSAQLKKLAIAAKRMRVKVRLGYNHRFHPALRKARELIDAEVAGTLMFLRGRYGHGGRKGYDTEWRANPSLSGGGELIDQGVHLIDLAGWFLGDFDSVEGHAVTCYWNMPVDDNAFISLRTRKGQTAWLHASCTEWKNMFSLEIYGRDAKIAIEGLGGSYGVERCVLYKMLPQMGPPETTIWEYPRGDESWKIEINEFIADIRDNRIPSPGLKEGIRTLEIVEKIYKKSGYNFNQATT